MSEKSPTNKGDQQDEVNTPLDTTAYYREFFTERRQLQIDAVTPAFQRATEQLRAAVLAAMQERPSACWWMVHLDPLTLFGGDRPTWWWNDAIDVLLSALNDAEYEVQMSEHPVYDKPEARAYIAHATGPGDRRSWVRQHHESRLPVKRPVTGREPPPIDAAAVAGSMFDTASSGGSAPSIVVESAHTESVSAETTPAEEEADATNPYTQQEQLIQRAEEEADAEEQRRYACAGRLLEREAHQDDASPHKDDASPHKDDASPADSFAKMQHIYVGLDYKPYAAVRLTYVGDGSARSPIWHMLRVRIRIVGCAREEAFT